MNPQHLILVHGCLEALYQLARTGDLRSKHYIHIPNIGDVVEYGVVPKRLNKKQLARIQAAQEFEVEVVAEEEGAWLRIPESVVASDPRWQMLAGKGILKAQWSGFHLKLGPLDEQALAIEMAMASTAECCAKCEYFQESNSCCLCIDSPLSGRQVDPGGYCMEYSAEIVDDSIEQTNSTADLVEESESFLEDNSWGSVANQDFL